MKLSKKWWLKLSAIFRDGFRGLALASLFVYRSFFSLLITAFFGNVCRFQPTCSHYAQIAFENHPPLTASWLTLRRLCKCHPLGPFGYDPVPERKVS